MITGQLEDGSAYAYTEQKWNLKWTSFACKSQTDQAGVFHADEDLIKWGWQEDVWFHVDKVSSAHVYLRLNPVSLLSLLLLPSYFYYTTMPHLIQYVQRIAASISQN